MWRLIKTLFWLVVLAIAVLAITGYKMQGKTVTEHFRSFTQNKAYKENVKDLRVLIGEAFKALGSEISDEVTEDERRQLDSLVKRELTGGAPIKGAPQQQALPPEKKNR